MRRLLRGFVLAAAVAGVCAPAVAAPTHAELEHARKLFAEAQRDQAAQRWQDALDKLSIIATIKDTPGIRFHTGNCLEHQGKLLEALEAFQRAHAMAEDARTHDVLQSVGNRIEQLRIRIPTLTIRVPPSDADTVVRVDGRELDRTLIGTPVGFNPGSHRIVIEFSRLAPIVRELVLYESRPETIEFVRPEPGPAPVASAPRPPPPDAPAPEPSRGPVPLGAWLTIGAGVAFAAGGVFAFISAEQLANDSREACARSIACDPDRASSVQRYDAWAVGLWSAGAVALGTGVVWALLPTRQSSSQLSLSAQPAGLRLQGAF